MLNLRIVDDVVVAAPDAPTGMTATEARAFDEAVEKVPGGANAVLDLSEVTFVDSAGIGCIVRLGRRLGNTGGELRLAAPNDVVQTVLELVRLHRMMEVYPTALEAVRSFRATDAGS